MELVATAVLVLGSAPVRAWSAPVRAWSAPVRAWSAPVGIASQVVLDASLLLFLLAGLLRKNIGVSTDTCFGLFRYPKIIVVMHTWQSLLTSLHNISVLHPFALKHIGFLACLSICF